MSTSGSSQLTSGAVLGRYQLGRRLGAGGMGEVFEARHLDLGKVVALKTLHGAGAARPDVQARFVREGQAAARIRHPNAADVTDVGVVNGVAYLVMEMLQGEDLQGLLRREGRLSPAAIAAQQELETVHPHGAAIRAAARAFGDRYHPIDLGTGEMLASADVEERLTQGFESVRAAVRDAGLAAQRKVQDALAKAQRVLPSLRAIGRGLVSTGHGGDRRPLAVGDRDDVGVVDAAADVVPGAGRASGSRPRRTAAFVGDV